MKKELLCVLSVAFQFAQTPPRVWAVVPPSTSLEEQKKPSGDVPEKRLEKAIEALESQEDRLRSVVDQLEEERQRLNEQDKHPTSPPTPTKDTEGHDGHRLH